jgi:hypothetical protein
LIGHSRAPAAGSTRTRPTLETLNWTFASGFSHHALQILK